MEGRNITIETDTKRVFDEWDKMPVEKKKKIAEQRKEFAKKTQGSIWFAPGFSFDSDSKIKLYEINA